MGVQNFTDFIRKGGALSDKHVSSFVFEAGTTQVAAVDVSVWMYRFFYTCNDSWIAHKCLERARTLRLNGIEPIFVFDGKAIEAKAETAAARARSNRKLRERAEKLAEEGKYEEAEELFAKCKTRTTSMETKVQEMCRKNQIRYIVSPFEADCQLAYLVHHGIADFIITIDSDLALYGMEKVFFGMDATGNGEVYEQKKMKRVLGAAYSLEAIRLMGLCVGQDYLMGGVYGMGLARGKEMYCTLGPNASIRNVMKYIRKNYQVPANFHQRLQKGLNTFKYQLVLDPISEKIVPMTPYPQGMDASNFPYAGKMEEAVVNQWIPTQPYQVRMPLASNVPLCFIECRYCNEHFPSLDALMQHKEVMHSTKCPICQLQCRWLSELEKHIETHKTTRDYICKVCHKDIKTAFALKQHMKLHEEKTHKCDICDKDFSRKDVMLKHRRVHKKEEPFKCYVCQEVFITEELLTIHKGLAHKDKMNYKCKECNKFFAKPSLLKNHMISHTRVKAFFCPICGNGYYRKNTMTRHIKDVHGTKKTDEGRKNTGGKKIEQGRKKEQQRMNVKERKIVRGGKNTGTKKNARGRRNVGGR